MNHDFINKHELDSEIAVLFIHGILGTPNHFNEFIKQTPKEISIYNVLLEGHGANVSDFANATMTQWKNQIDEKCCEIAVNHKKIIIVAHSMGTLFAIDNAIKYNDKVSNLFLIAPPMKPFIRPCMFLIANRVIRDKAKTKREISAKMSCSINLEKNLLKYLKWTPNFISLFKEIESTKKNIYKLKTDTKVFLSCKDEVVMIASEKYLKENDNIEIFKLKNSTHFYYDENEHKFMLNEYNKIIKER